MLQSNGHAVCYLTCPPIYTCKSQPTLLDVARRLRDGEPRCQKGLLRLSSARNRAFSRGTIKHSAQLICGILHALGAPELPPIADSEYDRFFILIIGPNKQDSALSFTVLRYCDPEE
jgi:hypothetical protein